MSNRVHIYPTEALTLCGRDATHPSVESLVHNIGAGQRCPDCERFEATGIAPIAADLFYVLSLKWTRRRDRLLTWWGPNRCGYRFRLEWSGRYARAEIEDPTQYLDDGECTLAVPCLEAEALAISAVDAFSISLDRPDATHPATDRVVEWEHLAAHMRKFMATEKRRKTRAARAAACLCPKHRKAVA